MSAAVAGTTSRSSMPPLIGTSTMARPHSKSSKAKAQNASGLDQPNRDPQAIPTPKPISVGPGMETGLTSSDSTSEPNTVPAANSSPPKATARERPISDRRPAGGTAGAALLMTAVVSGAGAQLQRP